MRYSINPEDRQLLEGYLNSMLDSDVDIPPATYEVVSQFIAHGSCEETAFNELFTDDTDNSIKQLLAEFQYGEIPDDGYHIAPVPEVVPYDEDLDQDYVRTLTLSEHTAHIDDAARRDAEFRLNFKYERDLEEAIRLSESGNAEASDTEPVPALPEDSDPQLPQTPSSFNWRSGMDWMLQFRRNPAAQGSVQARSNEDTYLGNDAL